MFLISETEIVPLAPHITERVARGALTSMRKCRIGGHIAAATPAVRPSVCLGDARSWTTARPSGNHIFAFGLRPSPTGCVLWEVQELGACRAASKPAVSRPATQARDVVCLRCGQPATLPRPHSRSAAGAGRAAAVASCGVWHFVGECRAGAAGMYICCPSCRCRLMETSLGCSSCRGQRESAAARRSGFCPVC